jgi:hypothetical protein
LQSDTANCGACGHDCLGASCAGGQCAPTLLATGSGLVDTIAVDATNVFFAVENAGINRMIKSGGAPSLIVPTPALLTGLSVDTSNLYWGAENVAPASIMRSAKDGTGLTTLASAPGVIGAARLVIDSAFAYYTWQSPAQLRKVPLAGGAVVTLAVTGPALGVAVNSTFAFWGDFAGTVFAIPLGGGAAAVLAQVAGGSATSLAADDCRVYFGCQNAGLGLWSVPAGGGTKTMIAATVGAVDAVRVDASRVYWAEIDSGQSPGPGDRIMRVNNDGTEPLQLAAGTLHPQALAVDDAFVYWSDASNHLYRVAK